MWAKTITDIIPAILSMIIFCYIINLYSNMLILLSFEIIIILVVLCTQSIGTLSAITFPNDTKLSMLFALFIFITFSVLGNNIIPIKGFHYSFKLLSEISFVRLSFESIMIVIYGFGRCGDREISTVLYGMDIEDDMF